MNFRKYNFASERKVVGKTLWQQTRSELDMKD